MTSQPAGEDTIWRLRCDVAGALALVWCARRLRGGDLRPEVHDFFADRYGRLARCYARRGDTRRSRRYDELATFHYRASGPTRPRAHAAVMPIPPFPIFTDAVSRSTHDPDDAA